MRKRFVVWDLTLNLPRSWYKISNQIEIARGVLKRTHCLRCKGCIVSYTGASRECNRGYTYTTHIRDAQAVSVRLHDTHTGTDDTMHAAASMSKEDTSEWAFDKCESPESLEHLSRATTPRAEDDALVQPVPEPGWVPLSVRQSQARERFEAQERVIAEAAAATKLAQIVASLVVDQVSGLPLIPDNCLPIKHYNRWLVANIARVDAVERRRSKSRIQANKVMRALVANSSPAIYANYCTELAVLEGGSPPLTPPTAPRAFCSKMSFLEHSWTDNIVFQARWLARTERCARRPPTADGHTRRLVRYYSTHSLKRRESMYSVAHTYSYYSFVQ